MSDYFAVGDVVVADPPYALACGSGVYPHAVVILSEPLILASREGAMRWSRVDFPLRKIGHLNWWQRRAAMSRLKS